MQVLVVIPTYNEAENIEPLVEALFGLGLDLGVLVVDDNSPDGTGQIADRLADRYPALSVLHRPGKQGLGKAYLAGFTYALERIKPELVVQMDADFSHDPAALSALVLAARQGRLAIGSRYVPGGGVRNWGMGRRLLSRFGSFYAANILGLPLSDVTSGFKCWPCQVLESINLAGIASTGYVFQVEMSYRAHLAGWPLAEVPITFVDRRAGQSKMSFSIALEAMSLVWLLRLKKKRLLAEIGQGPRQGSCI